MQITSPTWHLNEPCPCCGQGRPLLIACERCGAIAAECEEVGSFFPDPLRLTAAGSIKCAGCGAVGLQAFAPASDAQVQSAGFKPGQYQ
jgi:hypothetical protein